MTIPPVLAHGIGGRVDLPVPRWLFVYGAATVVVISFVALAALWPEPRLERDAPRGRVLPEALQRVLGGRPLEVLVRAVSFAFFAVVVAAALLGDDTALFNLAPVVVYIWFWVGMAFVHAVLGNWWATLSPFDTLGRLLGLEEDRGDYPNRWGRWPAAVILFVFVWMELVLPEGSNPRVLGVALLLYTAVTLAGMARYGRRTWNENGEAFAVYFDLLSRIAPFARDETGGVVVRPPLVGLPRVQPRPGLVAFLMVLIGSTAYDGLSRTELWLGVLGGTTGAARARLATLGLLAMVLLVAAVYTLAMRAAAAVSGEGWHPLAVRFAHSLVPIALAYTVAHYASLLLLEGQLGVALLSDPFSRGWDVLGTATWTINLGLISATAIWYVQVAAIVAGHVGGVVLAHDRSVATFPKRIAVRTQFALLAVMVAFTAGGLLILSGE